MLRFARRRIRDEALAEDAVQDALLAALGARHGFQGQSAVRTWLIGILNHKIQDAFRRETRYVRLDATGDDARDVEERPVRAAPATPAATADDDDPLREVARRRMHAALVEEVERLPEGLRSVFMMQAIEGVATAEVSEKLNITQVAAQPSCSSSAKSRSRWSPWISITPFRTVPPQPQRFLNCLARSSRAVGDSGSPVITVTPLPPRP